MTIDSLDALHAIVLSETNEAPVLSPSASYDYEDEKRTDHEVSSAAEEEGEDEQDEEEEEKEAQGEDQDQDNIRTGPLFVRTPSGKEVSAEEASKGHDEEGSPGNDVLSPLSDTTPKGRGLGFFKSLSGLSRQSISPASGASSIATAATQLSQAAFSPAHAALRKISLVKDVWVRESLYRAAALHQARVWHTCMGLLAKMSEAVKEIELERSVKLHAMLLDFLPRERRLFIGLPCIPKPVMEKLMSYREMDEEKIGEHIDEALHKRSRIVLRIDNDQRSSFMNRSRCKAPDLTLKVEKPMEGEPFETEMNRFAGVVERRVAAKTYKPTLAIMTADYYLHFFDIDEKSDIAVGMSPEEAYVKLLPQHQCPTSESKDLLPRTDKVLKDLTPTETINLINSTVTAVDGHLEVTETIAGRIREKASRKFSLQVGNDETEMWESVLKRRPADETASDGVKAMLSV